MTTLLGVLSVFASVYADDVNYSGTVVSKSGEPIMGATVTVTGTTVSTITDMDGRFSLVVPDGYSTVTVTYSGMKKQTVSVQREPVVLYESAEQAEQARALAMKKSSTPKRNYKKNAFNIEFGAGSSIGDWTDVFEEDYLSLSFGWHHGFSQYITWEVLNAGITIPADIDSYYDRSVLSGTTGIKLTTPRWKKLSLFASLNMGVGYDWYSEEAGLLVRYKIGVNFGKWAYLACKFDFMNLGDDTKYNDGYYDYYGTYNRYGYDGEVKFQTASVVLGFNL